MKYYIILAVILSLSTYPVFALNPPTITGASNQYCNNYQGVGLQIQLPSGTGTHIQKMVDNSGTWFDLTGKNYNYSAYNDYAFTTTPFTQLCNHIYSYRIAAEQGSTESSWSNTLSINTPTAPQNYIRTLSENLQISSSTIIQKQTLVSGVILSGILSTSQIGLTWTDSQPNIGWAVMRQTNNGIWQNISGDGCCVAVSKGPPLGYNDASIVSGQIYKYQVMTTGVTPQIISNIITINTTDWISTFNYNYPKTALNYSSINPLITSPQNGTAVFGIRINPSGVYFNSEFISNTPHPIGQITWAGTPHNGLWETLIRTGDGKTFTCICFGVDGLDGIWHPRSGIIESQNGTLQFVHYAENGHGGNWITNTIYFDANGNLILNKPPYVRDGGIIKQEVFNSDGLVHWSAVTPTITNCATMPNCK